MAGPVSAPTLKNITDRRQPGTPQKYFPDVSGARSAHLYLRKMSCASRHQTTALQFESTPNLVSCPPFLQPASSPCPCWRSSYVIHARTPPPPPPPPPPPRCADVRRAPCNRGPLRAVAVAQPGAEPPNQQAADAARAPDVPLAGSAATRAGGSKLAHANLPPVISTLVLVAAIFWLASALEYAGGDTFLGTCHAITALCASLCVIMLLTLKAVLAVASWFERR